MDLIEEFQEVQVVVFPAEALFSKATKIEDQRRNEPSFAIMPTPSCNSHQRESQIKGCDLHSVGGGGGTCGEYNWE
jgi:hypothetical protein